eukprot:Gb_32434 [translate_table: standard]
MAKYGNFLLSSIFNLRSLDGIKSHISGNICHSTQRFFTLQVCNAVIK